MAKQKRIRELSVGEYFTFTEMENPAEKYVCIREEYDRSLRNYLYSKFVDVYNSKHISGDTLVYTDFTF